MLSPFLSFIVGIPQQIESMEGGRQQLLEQQALQNSSYEEAIQQLQSQVSSVRSQYASLEKELQSTRDRRSDAEREAQQLKTQIISSNMLHEAELQRMHIAHVSQQDAVRVLQFNFSFFFFSVLCVSPPSSKRLPFGFNRCVGCRRTDIFGCLQVKTFFVSFDYSWNLVTFHPPTCIPCQLVSFD